MKKVLLSCIMFIWTCLLFAQNDYEKGYYVDTQGNRIEGYIKLINFDIVNDSKFSGLDFKTNLSENSGKIQMQNINEFGFDDQMKMVKTSVEMDDVTLFKDFNDQYDLNFKTVTVFLKVLLEGNPSLYSFPSEENGTKYFMKGENDKSPVQLVYKKYLADEGLVKENNKFREQLFKTVKTDDQVFNDFLNVKYEQKALIPFFEKYNKSRNNTYKVYTEKFTKSVKFNLTTFLGGYLTNFNMSDVYPSTVSTSKLTGSLGVEGELVMASEKWSVFTRLDYSYLKTDAKGSGPVSEYNHTLITDTYTLNSGFLDFVLGGRWYYGLTKSSKIFLGAGIGVNSPFGTITKSHNLTIPSDPTYSFTESNKISLGACPYFNFEAGYKFNKNLGLNFIYDTNKNILAGQNNMSAKFNRFGLNVRYTFN